MARKPEENKAVPRGVDAPVAGAVQVAKAEEFPRQEGHVIVSDRHLTIEEVTAHNREMTKQDDARAKEQRKEAEDRARKVPAFVDSRDDG